MPHEILDLYIEKRKRILNTPESYVEKIKLLENFPNERLVGEVETVLDDLATDWGLTDRQKGAIRTILTKVLHVVLLDERNVLIDIHAVTAGDIRSLADGDLEVLTGGRKSAQTLRALFGGPDDEV